MAAKISKKTVETKPKKKAVSKALPVKAAAAKAVKEKKAPAKKVSEKKQISNNSGSYIVLDHPIHNETIFGNHYAIRIGASQDGFVEICFNNGEWQPCRYSAGYWWFDWEYFTPGDYTIGVRLVDSDGKVLGQTGHRPCVVC